MEVNKCTACNVTPAVNNYDILNSLRSMMMFAIIMAALKNIGSNNTENLIDCKKVY